MSGELFYNALLLLYPMPFRRRFGGEMTQLFRDCYPASGRLGFWIRTFGDLFCSVPREWSREVHREDSEIDFTGVADALSICCVVGTLLFSWGWTGATIALDLKTAAVYPLPDVGAFLLMSVVTFVLAVLVGVLSALAAARTSRIETLCSQLANYEKPTARLLR